MLYKFISKIIKDFLLLVVDFLIKIFINTQFVDYLDIAKKYLESNILINLKLYDIPKLFISYLTTIYLNLF